MVTLQWERPYKFDNEPCKVTRYNVHYYCDRTGGQQTENKYQPFSVDSTKIFHYANVNVDTDQQCYFAVRVEAILGCSQTCNQESRVTFGVPLDINSEGQTNQILFNDYSNSKGHTVVSGLLQ